MTAYTERPRLRPIPDVSLTATAAFVVLALWTMGWNRQWSVAAYLVSFWHYYLYALAYYFGLVSMAVFKRDAVMMKTVALVALAFAYFQEPLDFTSLCVVAAGFLLNVVAAKALGADRTYYGYEVARLPHLRVTSFPYGWIAHPMIVGNIVAFGGTLLNEDFRTRWWPLALMHVAMNLGLLLMETTVVPQRCGDARFFVAERIVIRTCRRRIGLDRGRFRGSCPGTFGGGRRRGRLRIRPVLCLHVARLWMRRTTHPVARSAA